MGNADERKNDRTVWVFLGEGGRFPSAVFETRDLADVWILKHRLTGVLTEYPVNVGVYEWAQERAFFTPKKDEQYTAEFIGRFSSASQEHIHYEDGSATG